MKKMEKHIFKSWIIDLSNCFIYDFTKIKTSAWDHNLLKPNLPWWESYTIRLFEDLIILLVELWIIQNIIKWKRVNIKITINKDLTNVSYSCRPASNTAFLTMSLLHSSADSSWCAISAALNCKCTYKNIKINTKISL